MEHSEMQSESNEYVRKSMGLFTDSWRIKIALASYFDEHGKEVSEINWMNLEVQTTLLNTYPLKLIATILKALCVQLKENDQLDAAEEIASRVPEIPLECDQSLHGGRGFWDDVNDICHKISCWLPDAKRLDGYFLKLRPFSLVRWR